MCKKIIAMFLVVLMCAATIPFSAFAVENTDDNVVTGKVNVCGFDGGDFYFDFNSLTTADNTQYSDQLGILGALLSTDFLLDDSVKVTEKDGYVLEQLGFESKINIQNIRDEAIAGETDKDDYVVYSMGRKEVNTNGEKYSVYVLSIRGTVDLAEWLSDFDFGADIDAYYNTLGGRDKTEWSKDEYNHDHHKGFEVTGQRILKNIDEFIDSYKEKDANRKKTIFITGHSRGAAEGDVLGKVFEDRYRENGSIKPYTYTYGTPTTTTLSKSDAEKYQTIFNICNTDDLVTHVPPTAFQFQHYGKDIWVSVNDVEELKDNWDFGMFASFTAEYIKLFAKYALFDADDKSYTDPNLLLDYKSAQGPEVIKALLKVIPAQTREEVFECSQLVWVPKNIPDKYKEFYVDAPYGSVDETQSELSFDLFALTHNAKRVKISSFFVTALLKGLKEEKLQSDDINVERDINIIKEIFDEVKSRKSEYIKDDAKENQLLELNNSPALDITVFAYVLFCRFDESQEYSPKYVEGISEFLDTFSVRGLLNSHMPTTYYQIVKYLAKENLNDSIANANKALEDKLAEYALSEGYAQQGEKIVNDAKDEISKALFANDVKKLQDKYLLELNKLKAEDPSTPQDRTYIIGDSDSDTIITIADATLIQKFLAKVNDPLLKTSKTNLSMDCDLNGRIEIVDATLIQKYLAKFKEVEVFPIDEKRYID